MRKILLVPAIALAIFDQAAVGQAEGYAFKKFQGNQSEQFGASCAVIDDVNGDGIDDILIGAPTAGSGNAGRADVFSGLTNALIYSLVGAAAGDTHGASACRVADLDGDGVGEFAVGSPNAGSFAGAAVVYSGATGTVLYTLTAPGTFQLGFSVADAGDATGDGVSDILVGAPLSGSGFVGRAVLFSGATGLPVVAFTGAVSSGFLGWGVGSIGDVDGDGLADLLMGEPGANGSLGRALVFTSTTQSFSLVLNGTVASGRLGAVVANGGDLDGDGVNDVLAAANGGGTMGQVVAFSGASGTTLLTISGNFDGFGTSIAGGADVDGDQVPDIAVGAIAGVGYMEVYSGATGSALFRTVGNQNADRFGYSVATGEDFDGDGFVDFVVGARPLATLPNLPYARVVSMVGIPVGSSLFGSGCSGGAPVVPLIRVAGGQMTGASGNPNIQLVISQAPPGAFATFVIGLSNTVYNGAPLPQTLAPGCSLFVSVDQYSVVPINAGGKAMLPLPLASGTLAGTTVYAQVFTNPFPETGALALVTQ